MNLGVGAAGNRREIELLAPAGGREALQAAVECGADAVYLGAKGFNARRSADNFDAIGLNEAVEYCHLREVAVHVTLNTLVRQEEMAALFQEIEHIAQAGADAVIAQDWGVARAVREIAPEIALHASTQMAVHNREGVDFLAQAGFSRAVLAREMSLEEIQSCQGRGVALEVFCHGALCVSCSGQCLFSSLVGGRSGNRGLCAQPCRLPYRLAGREGYLLSPKDLMLLDALDELREAGVDSLKIEGRLKRPEYVAVVTDIYRRALDGKAISPQDREALLQIFNRGGFTEGYLHGLVDGAFLSLERPNHRGLEAGWGLKGRVRLERDVKAADALALFRDAKEEIPVKLLGRAGEIVPCPEARPGDRLYRLTSERQLWEARKRWENPERRIPLFARLTCRIGSPAELTVRAKEVSYTARGATVAKAERRPIDPARLEEQVKKTGGTAYIVEAVEIEAEDGAFLPVSEINALRREALAGLNQARLAPYRKMVRNPRGLEGEEAATYPGESRASFPGKPRLIARAGEAGQLLQALRAGADEIALEPRDLRPAALDLAAERLGGNEFCLVLPPAGFGGTLKALHAWAWRNREEIRATYLSNVGQLALDWPGERRGDYALNLMNPLAVREAGLEKYMPSLELTARQISQLPGEKELWVYGRAPLMQLKHCPLRAARGEQAQDPKMARPFGAGMDGIAQGSRAACRFCDFCAPEERCDRQFFLDRRLKKFPLGRLATEEGCVVRVFNSVPHRCLGRPLGDAAAWQVVLSPSEDACAILRLHRLALDGEDFRALPEWKALEGREFTTGHYFRGVD